MVEIFSTGHYLFLELYVVPNLGFAPYLEKNKLEKKKQNHFCDKESLNVEWLFT